jgi:thiopeptide-type bacteriocin biosynthesis protein
MIASEVADEWFFIRYGDPKHHIRLRLHGRPDDLTREVLPALTDVLAPAVRDGALSGIQYDCYRPEWDRYGGAKGLRAAEALFWRDSELVSALIEAVGWDAASQRSRLAVLSVDEIATALEITRPQKPEFFGYCLHSYGIEYEGAGARSARARFSQHLRAISAEVTGLLESADSWEQLGQGRSLGPHRARFHGAAAAVAELDREARLGVDRFSIASSIVHMHLNRLLRNADRRLETVVYAALERYWRSVLARAHGGRMGNAVHSVAAQ